MTPFVVSVAPATPLREVAQLMERHRIKRVPVLDAGRLVGIVSRADLVRSLAR
jgi:CBS domain-containing protein